MADLRLTSQCVAANCSSTRLCFRWPRNRLLAKKWTSFVQQKVQNFRFNSRSKLCHAHFQPDMFLNYDNYVKGVVNRLLLNKDIAIPSIHINKEDEVTPLRKMASPPRVKSRKSAPSRYRSDIPIVPYERGTLEQLAEMRAIKMMKRNRTKTTVSSVSIMCNIARLPPPTTERFDTGVVIIREEDYADTRSMSTSSSRDLAIKCDDPNCHLHNNDGCVEKEMENFASPASVFHSKGSIAADIKSAINEGKVKLGPLNDSCVVAETVCGDTTLQPILRSSDIMVDSRRAKSYAILDENIKSEPADDDFDMEKVEDSCLSSGDGVRQSTAHSPHSQRHYAPPFYSTIVTDGQLSESYVIEEDNIKFEPVDVDWIKKETDLDSRNLEEDNAFQDKDGPVLDAVTPVRISQQSAQKRVKEKNFKCTECPYSTDESDNSARHMSTHTGNKYTCTECQYSTSSYGSMAEHMERQVRGKAHRSKLCIYKPVHSDLNGTHMSKNMAESFKSKPCDYTSTTRYSPLDHVKKCRPTVQVETSSTGETFSCAYCNYTSARKFDLRVHMNIHTGVTFH